LLKVDQLTIEKAAGNVFQVKLIVEVNFPEWNLELSRITH